MSDVVAGDGERVGHVVARVVVAALGRILCAATIRPIGGEQAEIGAVRRVGYLTQARDVGIRLAVYVVGDDGVAIWHPVNGGIGQAGGTVACFHKQAVGLGADVAPRGDADARVARQRVAAIPGIVRTGGTGSTVEPKSHRDGT